MLSIIVPTHNEEKRIRATLLAVAGFLEKKRLPYEVIVVDDGTDATTGIVLALGKKNRKIRFIHFPLRLGKGGAVVEGFKAAKGDAVIYDADAATPPGEIPKLVEGLKKADVVVGSRKLPGSVVHGLSFTRRVASACFSTLASALFGLGIRDTQCGFKAVRRAACKKLVPQFVSKGFEWDVELLARAKRAGMRISEVPIEWFQRGGGTVRARDVWKMFWGLLALRKTLG
ncbi:MAG: glycosyltransferase [Candidatus Micrarchaeota archaeon]|nr:glycosyltransferase [Candidatus Micrarchaeota archaeon]